MRDCESFSKSNHLDSVKKVSALALLDQIMFT